MDRLRLKRNGFDCSLAGFNQSGQLQRQRLQYSEPATVHSANTDADAYSDADADATTAEMELGIPPRRRGSVAKADRRQRQGRAADEFLAKAR